MQANKQITQIASSVEEPRLLKRSQETLKRHLLSPRRLSLWPPKSSRVRTRSLAWMKDSKYRFQDSYLGRIDSLLEVKTSSIIVRLEGRLKMMIQMRQRTY